MSQSSQHSQHSHRSHSGGSFRRSSRSHPCPICGKNKGDCRVTSDGGLVLCINNHDDPHAEHAGYFYSGPTRDGTWGMYPRDDLAAEVAGLPRVSFSPPNFIGAEAASQPSAGYTHGHRRKHSPTPGHSFRLIASRLRPLTRSELDLAARWLGIPAAGIEAIGTLTMDNCADHGQLADGTWHRLHLVTPEQHYDAAAMTSGNWIIAGYSVRYPDNSKMTFGCGLEGQPGRGVIIPPKFNERAAANPTQPIFLVEGPSDCATLTALGLLAIGRPNNMAGGAEAAACVRDLLKANPNRQLVIVGEHDRKKDGKWPGRDGGLHFGSELIAALDSSNSTTQPNVMLAFPPQGIKDVRAWYHAQAKHGVADAYLGAELSALLLADATRVGVELGMGTNPATAAGETASKASNEQPATSNTTSNSNDDPTLHARLAATLSALAESPEAAMYEESAAAANVCAARRDFDRYPCHHCRFPINQDLDSGEIRVRKVRCEKRHRCIGCRAYLDHREMSNVRLRLTTAEREGVKLHSYLVPDAEWRRFRKRLTRNDARYIAVASDHDGAAAWFVVCTLGEDITATAAASTTATSNPPLPPPPTLTAAEAIEAIAVRLTLCATETRPIRTCHAWKLIDLQKQQAANEQRLGMGDPTLTTSTIVSIAEACGGTATPRGSHRGNPRIQWTMGIQCPTDEIDRLLHCLYCGELLPEIDYQQEPPPPSSGNSIEDDLDLTG